MTLSGARILQGAPQTLAIDCDPPTRNRRYLPGLFLMHNRSVSHRRTRYVSRDFVIRSATALNWAESSKVGKDNDIVLRTPESDGWNILCVYRS